MNILFPILLILLPLILVAVLFIKEFNKNEKVLTAECDHTYFPVQVNNTFIGQECTLCGEFNSVEQIFGEDYVKSHPEHFKVLNRIKITE
jgi:hypothetical protein